MSKVGNRWSAEENEKLTKLYTIDMLNIDEIATIHQRKPAGIVARLILLKLIEDASDARGYNASDKSKQNLNEKLASVRTTKTPDIRENHNIFCSSCIILQNEISMLKADLMSMNKTLADVTALL